METRILVPNGLKIVIGEFRQRKKSRICPTSKSSGKIVASGAEDEKPSSSSGHFETSDQENRRRSSSTSSSANNSSGEETANYDEYEYRSSYTCSSSSSSSSSSDSENEKEFVNGRSKSTLDNVIGSSENSSSKRTKSRKRKKDSKAVRVCASRVIEKGTVFSGNEGEVQIVHLKDTSLPDVAKDDIRFMFGCFEKVTTSALTPTETTPIISSATSSAHDNADSKLNEPNNSNLIRLCNWVRFLRRTSIHKTRGETGNNNNVPSNSDSDDGYIPSYKRRGGEVVDDDIADTDYANIANDLRKQSLTTVKGVDHRGSTSNNIIARFVDGRPIFEVTTRLVPGTELLAYFDMDSITQSSSPFMMMMTMPAAIIPNHHHHHPSSSSPHLPQPPSSSLISSSSKLSGQQGSNNSLMMTGGDRDQMEQQRLLSMYPFPFHHYDGKQNNSFSFGGGYAGMRVAGMLDYVGKMYGGGGKHSYTGSGSKDGNRTIVSSLPDGPLDLSKLPHIDHLRSNVLSEPLKIGTPFDSPDSNEDDCKELATAKGVKSNSLRSGSTGSPSTLFSIRNVLKQPSSPRSKLFQPYSLEGERESTRNKFNYNRSSTPPSSAAHHQTNTTTSLATPSSISSSSHSPIVTRNSPVLRPILRTRGRERSLLPCDVCGKAFDRPSLLKRHLRTHTGEKPHICDVCSKGFSTSSSLNTHRRIHSGEKPHQCPICGKRFTASSNLYYHRMTHNKEKPHKCMLCGKSFPTPGDLKSHQYVHSGSWPYTCPVCHRGFSKQTNLRNHLLLHSGMSNSSSKSGDKPHTCQICDKKFALACNLRAHLRTHEEDPISTCSICKRTFLSSLNMLVNGRCRSCLLNLNLQSNSSTSSSIGGQRSSSSPSSHSQAENNAKGSLENSLMSRSRISSSAPSNSQPVPNAASQISSLAMSQIPGFSVPLPGSLALPMTSGLHYPVVTQSQSTNAAAAAAAAAASLFRSGSTTASAALSATGSASNPFLEHLFEWNYRFAKETAGNLSLSIMQQKLLESQVLAAQLMSVSANAPTFSVPDLLRLRSAEFSQMDAVSENKYLQR